MAETKQNSGQKSDQVVDRIPVEKDPLWPTQVTNVVPLVAGWRCAQCGGQAHRSKKDPNLCDECVRGSAQISNIGATRNANWMELAKELGLELFERQPEETDLEWRIWEKYRSYYPLALPTVSKLSQEVGCSPAIVTRTMQLWSFRVRMIEWARFVDADLQEDRILAIREMNKKQLSMAQNIQDKLVMAIDYLDPETLKPNELVNLMKLAVELETRIVEHVQERVESSMIADTTKKQDVTKQEDMAEIIAILKRAGALDDKVLAVETTTRLIAKEE